MKIRFKSWFIRGLLVGLPIILTVYIIVSIVSFFDSLIVENLFHNTILNKIPGLGLIFSLVLMIVIGWVASNFLGRFFIKGSEYVFSKIPLVKTIYSTIKQIFDTILSSNSQAFKHVVLIEYPREGLWVLGFVTSETGKAVSKHISNEDFLNVFIPTTPNPTSGFLLFVPKSQAKQLDMPPDVAMKLIVSGGVINIDTVENPPVDDKK